ncbi:MAG: 1-phosphofructokinase [Lachnospiraceae bacterium]
MIYTVTLNPSLDYVFTVSDFATGKTNRSQEEAIYPGGKGINVSLMLQHLGISSTALGFVAGFTGKEITARLQDLGLVTDFVNLPEGFSRINCKFRNLESTEINGSGPKIPERSYEALLNKLDGLQAGDVLFLCGSIPSSLPRDTYAKIADRLAGRGVLIVADAAGEVLRKILPCHPFLVKPNRDELGAFFGVRITDMASVVPYAKKLRDLGAENALVSLGGDGAVLAATDGKTYLAPAPKGKLVNAVGSGDAMVAGFAASWIKTGDPREALRLGLACGSASAFCERFASREQVETLMKSISVQEKQEAL